MDSEDMHADRLLQVGKARHPSVATALPMKSRTGVSLGMNLGYATSSVFIAMFRRLTGTSPGRFVSGAP